MKNDTSNNPTVDLDTLFESSTEHNTTNEEIVSDYSHVDFARILNEVCYKLPKGYPTVVDGVLTEREEIVIINEALEAEGLPTIPLPTLEEAETTSSSVSSNKTDLKEAMVMVFFDSLRSKPDFAKTYQSIYTKPTKENLKALKEALVASKGQGSDYGSGVNIENLHKYIAQTLASPDRKKANKDLEVVNNGFSAANTIISDEALSQYISKGKGWKATRGAVFNAIRTNAVQIFQGMKINLNYPDNWCPGDFYLMKKLVVPKTENLIDLNAHFRGPGYVNGDIFAISLKMEDAQAGKGTTFIQSVLKPKEISVAKAYAKNTDSKIGKQYLEAKRRLYKNETYQDPEAFFSKLSGYAKFLGVLAKSKAPTPLIDQLNLIKGRSEKVAYFTKKRKAIVQEMLNITKVLDKTMLGAKQTGAYEKGFEESFNEFVKYLNKIGIKRTDSKNAAEFVKAIKQSKGAAAEGGVTKLLIKKADAYALAVKLIESWSDENKTIAKPFERLGAINNPLLAITMFAIAQHGANPNFAKVHGSNSGPLGTAEMFPAKSKVDENSMIQTVKINDSPGAAGFDVVYNMKLNNIAYSTKLTFRFSTSQIRVEVQELEAANKV